MQPGAVSTIHQRVQVTYDFPVHFTDNAFSGTNETIRALCLPSVGRTSAKVLVVLDAGVSQAFVDIRADIESYFADERSRASLVRSPIIVAGGESIKNNLLSVNEILEAIEHYGIDRHSYVIVIGGGALLDMAGFAAAIAHRGVRLIRLPSTVLSQDDSGVGVKNSVNFFGKKNFIGTFAPPYAVINDMQLLTRLPDRDWLGGVSEAVKVSLLKDAEFFAFIEQHAADLVKRDIETMRWIVYRSAQHHLNHIATSGDAFEFGSSRPLDFGHWAAHKLEQISGYQWRHGEAVAIGIALDSTYSYLAGMLPEVDWKRIVSVFLSLNLPVYAKELLAAKTASGELEILAGLNEFREHLGGQLTIMLLHGIGAGVEVHDMDESRIVSSIELLRDLQDARSLTKEEIHGSKQCEQLSSFTTGTD